MSAHEIAGKSNECCRHCRKGCDGLGDLGQLNHRDEAHNAEWYDDGCPACKVADAIEAEVIRLADSWGWDTSRIRDYCGGDADILAGMLDAAKIARGET